MILCTKKYSTGIGLLGVIDALLMFCIGKFLPDLGRAIGLGHIFMLCATSIVTTLIFLWAFVPETKGQTLEEIEEYYRVKCYGENYDMDKVSSVIDKLSLYDRKLSICEEMTADNFDTQSTYSRRTSLRRASLY